jgi:hypothetical protein
LPFSQRDVIFHGCGRIRLVLEEGEVDFAGVVIVAGEEVTATTM